MLRLEKFLLPFRRSASPIHLSPHRALLSTAAAASSPANFAAEDYLVTTCGLTKEQAAKGRKYVAHWKSPSNANAVLAYLASPPLGLSQADITRLVTRDPRILNCSIEKTLKPRIDGFFSHGFTAAQIRTFVRQAAVALRCLDTDGKLGFWLPFLGSPERFLHLIKRNSYIVTSNLERTVKANIQLLRESGLSDSDVAKLCVCNARLLTSKPDSVRVILKRAEELGVPRNSLMFRQAVNSTACIGPETMAAKLKFMGEMLGRSEAEVAKAVKMAPVLLRCSREKLQRVSEFLTKVVGINAKCILSSPAILMYSLERRIAPRHYVMKALKGKGLMHKEKSFFSLVTATDKSFQSRYINPHKDVLPGLADAYAYACKGTTPI